MKKIIVVLVLAALVIPLLDAPSAILRATTGPTPLKESELALLQGGRLFACAASLLSLGGAIGGYGGAVLAASGPIGWGMGAVLVGGLAVLAATGAASGYNC